MKKCSFCNEVKPLQAFNKQTKSKDGYRCNCRDCQRKARKEPPRRWYQVIVDDKKMCRRCSQWLPLNDFYKCSSEKTGLRCYCAKCVRVEASIRRAKKKGLKSASLEEMVKWVHRQEGTCHYCGNPANATDRRDNTKGYTLDNIVPACTRCNTIKGEWLTEEQMLVIANLFFKT